MSETRGRHWCFTTYDLTLLDRLPSLAESGTLRYVCAQVEQCPTTGKEHVQGYLETPQKRSIPSLKKILNDVTVHVEVRRGSRDAARDYCRKEESRLWGPYEFGEWIGGQGTVTVSPRFVRRLIASVQEPAPTSKPSKKRAKKGAPPKISQTSTSRLGSSTIGPSRNINALLRATEIGQWRSTPSSDLQDLVKSLVPRRYYSLLQSLYCHRVSCTPCQERECSDGCELERELMRLKYFVWPYGSSIFRHHEHDYSVSDYFTE